MTPAAPPLTVGPPPTVRPHARRRPRWVIIVLTSLLAVALAGYGLYRYGLTAPGSGAEQDFHIASGQTAPQVADALREAGLIRDRNAFITYLNLHGLRGLLKAGGYRLSPRLTAPQVASIITSGQTSAHQLTVPEGYRLSQIRAAAVQRGIAATDFDAALAAAHPQDFLSGKPAAVSLEGYLFPATYRLEPGATAAQLVDQMLSTFGKKVGVEYVQTFSAQGLSLHQGLTLASIVEREVSIPADRPVVAQIFLKRFREGMPLGSDVTTHYAADLLNRPFDININSPYNTRLVTGLPPGPICSPGLTALDAVAHPAATDYLYFLSGRDGKTYYAHTYPQHQANIVKYLD